MRGTATYDQAFEPRMSMDLHSGGGHHDHINEGHTAYDQALEPRMSMDLRVGG